MYQMICGAPIDRGPHARNTTAFDDGIGFLVHIPEHTFCGNLGSQALSSLYQVTSMRLQDARAEFLVPRVFRVISEGTLLADPAAVPLATSNNA